MKIKKQVIDSLSTLQYLNSLNLYCTATTSSSAWLLYVELLGWAVILAVEGLALFLLSVVILVIE